MPEAASTGVFRDAPNKEVSTREGTLPFRIALFSQAAEGINGAHGSVKPVGFKVLGQQLRQSIVFGVSPQVRVEPAQSIGRTTANSLTQNTFIRIEDGELLQEFFGFAQGFGRGKITCS